MPGQFLKLSQGITYCRWVGSTRGPSAVVVHGVSTPMVAVEGLAKTLGAMGYRVLLYDLYGRGLSDAPKGRQSQAFFVKQLADLCAAQALTDDLTVVGYSMGGNVATAFGVAYPHTVKQVIMVAPAGFALTEGRFVRYCRTVPILGDWVHAMFAKLHFLVTRERRSKNEAAAQVNATLAQQYRRKGYRPAVLSSWRHTLAKPQEADVRRLSALGIPVAAIWARNDKIIPQRSSGLLAEWYREALQEVVEDADHSLPYADPPGLSEALQRVIRDIARP